MKGFTLALFGDGAQSVSRDGTGSRWWPLLLRRVGDARAPGWAEGVWPQPTLHETEPPTSDLMVALMMECQLVLRVHGCDVHAVPNSKWKRRREGCHTVGIRPAGLGLWWSYELRSRGPEASILALHNNNLAGWARALEERVPVHEHGQSLMVGGPEATNSAATRVVAFSSATCVEHP